MKFKEMAPALQLADPFVTLPVVEGEHSRVLVLAIW